MIGFLLYPVQLVLVYLYAPYKSFKAVESHDSADDTAWLTFWVVQALFTAIEGWSDALVWWFPFYDEAKFAVLVWMLFFNGSQTLYTTAIKPFLQQHEHDIDQMWAGLDRNAQDLRARMGDSELLRSALEHADMFMALHGRETYEKVVKIASEHAVQQATGTGVHGKYH